MFLSHQKFFDVPLVMYEHVYEVSSLYDIGKLAIQNPCFQEITVRYYMMMKETLYDAN